MDEFYTVDQTAIALKVHSLTVRRYIRDGKLKAFRAGGNIRISLNDLRAFTQNFIPHQKQTKQQTDPQTQVKEFSYADPILNLKGRGLSISKLESQR